MELRWGKDFRLYTLSDSWLGRPARLNAGCPNYHLAPACPTTCTAYDISPFFLQGLYLPIWNHQLLKHRSKNSLVNFPLRKQTEAQRGTRASSSHIAN